MMPAMNRRVWLSATAALASVTVVVIGVRVWTAWQTQTPARKYLDSVHIAGYQRLSVTNDQGGGNTDATGIFFGPAQSLGSLTKAVIAPSL